MAASSASSRATTCSTRSLEVSRATRLRILLLLVDQLATGLEHVVEQAAAVARFPFGIRLGLLELYLIAFAVQPRNRINPIAIFRAPEFHCLDDALVLDPFLG